MQEPKDLFHLMTTVNEGSNMK